jgi:glutamyl-Q tRNA(Asp) synthetase
VRFRVPAGVIGFDDLLQGHVEENVAEETGDFVVKRADGVFAYQLAVVVDDAEQGITQVVRGADLLTSTPRQIALQRALGLPSPEYAHLPLALNADGSKISKREGAVPVDPMRIEETLEEVYRILGFR